MARTRKNNKKGNRSGTTAARTAQPRARRDGDQAASADAPVGLPPAQASGQTSANSAQSGLTPAKTVPAKTVPPKTVPPGLTPAKTVPPKTVPPGLTPAKTVPPKTVPPGLTPANNVPAEKVPPGLAPAKKVSPGLVPRTGEYAKLVPPMGGSDGLTPVRPRDEKAVAASAGAAARTPPAGTSDDLPSWAAKAVEELLTPTYWLDPGEAGDPFSATIRFSGRRADVTGKPEPRDSFAQEETVDGIVPGSGPVAITTEVRDINPGQWTVTARPVTRTGPRPYQPYPPPGENADASRAPWPRRVSIPAKPEATVHTAALLRTKVPGIIRFAYASLVSLGVLVGLGLEALLLTHGHYSLLRPMVFSVVAIVAGVIGGKAWYIAVHRGRKFDGWCIQGFVAGAAVVVAAAALAGPGIPAGAFLAAAAPALLIGMAIGRLGCFWAGCCTGRPTASRWAIWSSDRKVGCRRAPAQLLEALAALISGVAVLAVVLVWGLERSGPVAVVGLAAYTLARQFILGLRAEPRVWQYGRRVTAAVAGIALIAGVVLLARG